MKRSSVSLLILLAAMMAFPGCSSSEKPAETAGHTEQEATPPVQEAASSENPSSAVQTAEDVSSDWEDDLLMPEDTPTWDAELDTEETSSSEESSETEESTDMAETASGTEERTDMTDSPSGTEAAAGVTEALSGTEAAAGMTEAPSGAEAGADMTEAASGAALPADDELAWENETFGPQVLDDAGRARVYDLTDNVSAWIPVPKGYYTDETYSNRNALVIYPVDTDTLNADAAYYVYDTEDGYLDFNMDDPLTEEALMLSGDEEFSVDGPSDIVTFQVGSREMMGASLFVSYIPEDGAPLYTSRYLIWTHLDERTIVTCLIGAASANPEPLLSMEEAGRMFLSPVSLK